MQASPDIVPIMAGDCDTVGLGRAAVGCIAVAADRSGNGIITNIDIRRFDANQREPSEMRSWVRQIEQRGDSRTYPFASVKAWHRRRRRYRAEVGGEGKPAGSRGIF
jgi:hypothetical protein